MLGGTDRQTDQVPPVVEWSQYRKQSKQGMDKPLAVFTCFLPANVTGLNCKLREVSVYQVALPEC